MRLWLCEGISSILLGRRSPGGDHVLCKSTDVTTKHIKLIARAFTITSWFSIAYVRCGLWLCCRVSALHSVVAGSIFGIHCWWDLINSKQLFRMLHAVFAGFSVHDSSIYNRFYNNYFWFMSSYFIQRRWLIQLVSFMFSRFMCFSLSATDIFSILKKETQSFIKFLRK